MTATARILQRFRHIAIEGAIGVGKTTLSRRLATHLGAELLLEQAGENPYLERYYRDMRGYAFQTQLAFLFQRVRQMQAIAQPGMFASSLVSDFMFEKDAIFAGLTLDDDEFRLYSRMYAEVAPQVAAPDLVVWLQASPATLLQRIHGRGIESEQAIDAAYLERLCEAYAGHFQTDDTVPVLAVGTERFDPAHDPAAFDALLERIAAFEGGRSYFNSSVDIALL